MIIKEYFIMFTHLANYSLAMVSESKAHMRKFVVGFSVDKVKECRTTIFVKEKNISRIMVHVQHT